MSTLKRRVLHACPTPGLLDQRQPDEALIEVRWTCDECGQHWAGRVKKSHVGPWYEEWKRVRGFRWFRGDW